ncbi:class I SAM-dependent methyltransferase [Clostridioides difficile]|uniref:class I SAM-dependent methyltransferase n=1 Tax=Clostridioides difficile TaxID=1496 RepID=UPI001ED9CB04|nr:methyltransferase domain-containing protein [Clostridioides difficile]
MKGYVEELLFLDNSYDIVFSCIVFHHCTNVQNMFLEMIRVLNVRGKFIMFDT